jgi:hypothetical protein
MIRMSCDATKAQCLDSRDIGAYSNLLEKSKTNPILSSLLPFSENEIKIARKALDEYKKDCERCATNAKNDYNCLAVAREKFSRNMPSSYKDVYPWRNYDWDYANFASNQYSTKALPKGDLKSFGGLKRNVSNIVKSIDGLIFDPSPNYLSNSFGNDKNSDYPIHECKGDQVCSTTESIRRTKEKPPTKDNFIKKFSTDGIYSSSYYYKIGSCRRPDIDDMKKCEEQGYKWVPNSIDGGSCIQPRYMFVDNSPKPFFNGSNGRGYIPSILNDVRDIMPDKLFNNLLGQSTEGVQIQMCPTEEGFINNDNMINKIGIVVLLGLIMVYIGKKLK